MTDSVLEKYTGKGPGDSVLHLHQAGTGADGLGRSEDLGCFGWLRGVRDRAIMLELRRKDGSIMAISYAYIERIEFDPSEGITLHAAGRTVRIKGRNLNVASREGVQLFEGITRNRVTWVGEMNQRTSSPCSANEPQAITIEW